MLALGLAASFAVVGCSTNSAGPAASDAPDADGSAAASSSVQVAAAQSGVLLTLAQMTGSKVWEGRDLEAIDPFVDVEPLPSDVDKAAILLAETERNTAKFADRAAAIDAGYKSIGDRLTGVEHLVNWDLVEDPAILDVTAPEGLVYESSGDTSVLVAAMFMLPWWQTIVDIPYVAGSLTPWRVYDRFCWADGVVVGIWRTNTCRPEGTYEVSSPILHVFVVDNPYGRFAHTRLGLDRTNLGLSVWWRALNDGVTP